MFILKAPPKHLLSPRDYSTSNICTEEKRKIFANEWLLVAHRDNLRENGQYVAIELFGVPVLVRNEQGEIVAFKNICAHRKSQLVLNGCGSSASLKCQYHGWEYDREGRISKIPDAPNFAPADLKRARLNRISCETWGDFVYVHFGNDSEPFANRFKGKSSDLVDYYTDRQIIADLDIEVSANWKLIVENAVESYHVPMVHPTIFKNFRAEDLHDHEATEAYTYYLDLLPLTGGWFERIYKFFHDVLAPKRTFNRFVHVHMFPNHLFYYSALLSQYVVVEPISADRTRYRQFLLFPKNLRVSWLGALIGLPLKWYLKRALRRINFEDLKMLPGVHAGNANSQDIGILSRREERVFFFQEYWQKKMELTSN